jgi:hypothetical protein
MKLVKSCYYDKNGEKKVNTFLINIPKAVVCETNLEDKQLKVYTQDNKIIIEQDKNEK